MGVGESIKGFYFKVEDRYYSLAEWLQERGLPMIRYFVEPIENQGIPSFPVFFAILVFIALGILFAAGAFAPGNTTFKVQLASQGRAINDIPVSLMVPGEKAPRTATARNGIATFSNVPSGALVTVSVRHPDYANFTRSIQVMPDQTFKANLEPAAVEATSVFVTLRVKDDRGSGLPDTRISFSDPGTGEYKEVTTDASGIARVQVSDPNQLYPITLSKDGFSARPYTLTPSVRLADEVTLSASKDTPADVGGTQPVKGTVVVTVKGGDGNRMEGAKVSLFDASAYTTLDVSSTNSEGVATFPQVPAGKRVYVNVEPPADNVRDHNPYYGVEDAINVRENGDTEFRVELAKKAPTEVNTITVKVLSDTGTPLEHARVSLREMGSNAPLGATKETGTDGTIVLPLSPGVAAYATAFKGGYLPGRAMLLKAGDAATIQLIASIVGNNGDVEVTVKDADGAVVPAAKVRIEQADGFDLGVTETDSGADGVSLFTQIPTGVSLRIRSSQGPLSGVSDTFTVSPTDVGDAAKKVSVSLDPSFGDVLATAGDVSQPSKLVPSASFIALENGETQISNCTATGNASSCILRVRAGRNVVIRASAPGFADSDSAPLFITAQARKEVKVFMLPSDLTSQLRVELTGVFPVLGTSPNAVSPDELERGMPYYAEFFFNNPTSDRAGVSVRLGDGASVSDDAAGLVNVLAPNGATVVTQSTYNPTTGCLAESTEPVDNAFKSASIEFRNKTQASQSFRVKFYVKPTAAAGAKVPIYFRTWASRASAYSRDPVDAVLGNARNVPSKQECYAESKSKVLTVVDGGSTCNDKACISVSFTDKADPTNKGGRGWQTAYNKPFTATVTARSFIALDPSSAYIKVSNARDRNIRLGNDFEARLTPSNMPVQPPIVVAADVDALPVLPAPTTKIFVEFGDARGVLVSDEYELRVDGRTGVALVVNATPQLLQANIDQDLVVFVRTNPQGTPIEHAKVELLESQGAAFNGELPASLEGDGTEDNGLDGRYVFKRISPVAPGKILIRVTVDPKLLFKISETQLNVAAFDFLEFTPESISLSGDSCNKSTELAVNNPLQSDVVVRYRFVDETPCVDLLAAGSWAPGTSRTVKKSTARKQSSLKVSMRAGSQRVSASSQCTISFDYNVKGQPGYITTDLIVPASVDCPMALPVQFKELPPGIRPCVTDNDAACGGEYAPQGTCYKPSCTCQPDPVTGELPASCDPQSSFPVVDQCVLKADGKPFGYPLSPDTSQPASCIAGQCEVGLCSCKEALLNKYTDLLFNNLWYNYMLSTMTAQQPQFTDAIGGFVVKFTPGTGVIQDVVTKSPTYLYKSQAAPGAEPDSGLIWDLSQVKGVADAQLPGKNEATGPCKDAGPGAICMSVSDLSQYAAISLVFDNSGKSQGPLPGGILGVLPGSGAASGTKSFEFSVPECWTAHRVEAGSRNLGLLSLVDFFGILSKVEQNIRGDAMPTRLAADESQAYFLWFNPSCAPGGVFPEGVPAKTFTFTFGQEGRKITKKVVVTAKGLPNRLLAALSPGDQSKIVARTDKVLEPVLLVNNVIGGNQSKVKFIVDANSDKSVDPNAVSQTDLDLSSKPTFSVRRRYDGLSRELPVLKLTVDNKAKSVPASVKELTKYDVIGNVKDGKEYGTQTTEDCGQSDFCISNGVWSDKLKEDFAKGLEGSMLTGARSAVIEDVPNTGNTFVNAFLVALYDTTQAACSDGEFMECVQNKKSGRPAAFGAAGGFGGFGGPSQFGGQGYPAYPASGYDTNYYPGSQGIQGMPGFSGQFNSQCNFQQTLDSLCSKFFGGDNRFKNKDRMARIGNIAGSQAGTVFCSVAILSLLGAVGPGARPVMAPTLGGQWGQGAQFGANFFLASAVQKAREKLFGRTQPDKLTIYAVPDPWNTDKSLDIKVPWRKAGKDGGLVYTSFAIAGKDNAVTANTTVQASTTGDKVGYPYLDCSAGASCVVNYSAIDKPVLATINKYKPVNHPELGDDADALDLKPLWGEASKITDLPINVFSASRAYACAPASLNSNNLTVEFKSADFVYKPSLYAGSRVWKCVSTNLLANGVITVVPSKKTDYKPTNPLANNTGYPVAPRMPASGSPILDANPFFVLGLGDFDDSAQVVLPVAQTDTVGKVAKLDFALTDLDAKLGGIISGTAGAPAPTQARKFADIFGTAAGVGGTPASGSNVNSTDFCNGLVDAKAKLQAAYDAEISILVKPETKDAQYLAEQAVMKFAVALKNLQTNGNCTGSVSLGAFNRSAKDVGAAAGLLAKTVRSLLLANAKRTIDQEDSAEVKSDELRAVVKALNGLPDSGLNNTLWPEVNFAVNAVSNLLNVDPKLPAVFFDKLPSDDDANNKELALVYYGQVVAAARKATTDPKTPEFLASMKPRVSVPIAGDVDMKGGVVLTPGKEWGAKAVGLYTYFLDEKSDASALDTFRNQHKCQLGYPSAAVLKTADSDVVEGSQFNMICDEGRKPFKKPGTAELGLRNVLFERVLELSTDAITSKKP